MQSLQPPEFVKTIISRLEAAGFEAYMVGGCVRDILMGRVPKDWDVTTSARPEEIRSIFESTVPTGERHGTVTVIIDGNQAEVTAFRSESAYTDHRRPDAVTFVSDLAEDLERRDFTINAMAMRTDGTLIDYFGGKIDLEAGIIRCVGNAGERFTEDALRMLRALRFCAELGFEIEPLTFAALKDCAPLSVHLSPERVRGELCRILLSDRPATIEKAFALGLMDNYVRPGEIVLVGLPLLPRRLEPRLCYLCINLLRSGQIKETTAFLSALRFDKRTISLVSKAAALLLEGLPDTSGAMKRALFKSGHDAVSLALQTSLDCEALSLLESVASSGDCFTLDCLAIKGDDLLSLGFRGKAVGEALLFLLEHVIDNPDDNERNILLNIIKY
jgi:tRNA nucleotidyltransferase (CCA-adding enzyme)